MSKAHNPQALELAKQKLEGIGQAGLMQPDLPERLMTSYGINRVNAVNLIVAEMRKRERLGR